MARSRSRRDRSSARPARGPQFAVQASIGRGRQPASRRLGLLPRSLPVGLSRRLVRAFGPTARTVRSNAIIRNLRVRSVADAVREAKRVRRMLRAPVANRRDSLCVRRSERRQIMHARGVAGRSGAAWSRMMQGSRRLSSSFYSCRR